MATTAKRPPSFLDPARLYSLRGFQECTGLGKTKIREARLQGLPLPTIKVGRRLFIRGAEGIAYVEKLATL